MTILFFCLSKKKVKKKRRKSIEENLIKSHLILTSRIKDVKSEEQNDGEKVFGEMRWTSTCII